MSRLTSLALALSAAAAAAGCGDDTETVATDVPRVTATPTCVPLAAGSRVLGVSSEGELWLVDGASHQTTVLDATGATRSGMARADDASAVLPWSQQAATLLVDGELWTVQGDGREFLSLPAELGKVGQVCGNPTAERGAFVDTEQGLFERLGGFWWRWTQAGGDGFGTARQLVRNDGSCVGTDDVMWMVNTAGQLWQLAPDDARIVAADRGPITSAAAAGREGAAALTADGMILGPPWHAVDFAAGAPTTIAGGGGGLWVQAGGEVYQRTGGAWRAIDGLAPGAVAIHPHEAAGAWFEYADQVCHAALGEPLIIHGLEPYEHRVAALANLTVSSRGTELTVERDGGALTSLTSAGDHELLGFDLGPPGWHALTIKAGGARRDLDYDVVDLPQRSWATDVQPIYAANCEGYACHGPMPGGTQVDLSTYQAWRTRAPRIRERLIRGEMPPVPPRLSSDNVAIVLQSIEGGMKP